MMQHGAGYTSPKPPQLIRNAVSAEARSLSHGHTSSMIKVELKHYAGAVTVTDKTDKNSLTPYEKAIKVIEDIEDKYGSEAKTINDIILDLYKEILKDGEGLKLWNSEENRLLKSILYLVILLRKEQMSVTLELTDALRTLWNTVEQLTEDIQIAIERLTWEHAKHEPVKIDPNDPRFC